MTATLPLSALTHERHSNCFKHLPREHPSSCGRMQMLAVARAACLPQVLCIIASICF